MRYLGGKKRLAKRIAAILDAHRSDGQPFVDVFCGSLAVSAAMPNRGPHIANDACEPLINMYKAWREGWRPPEHVSEELYAELKAKQDPNDPLTAFVGFGCSYGGKWFGGYARGWVPTGPKSRSVPSNYPGAIEVNQAELAQNSLARCMQACAGVELQNKQFEQLSVQAGALVYCDPEYRDTTRYSYFRQFDHSLFVDTAGAWADKGAVVFVSEYVSLSSRWELVAEWPRRQNVGRQSRVEKLFRVRET